MAAMPVVDSPEESSLVPYMAGTFHDSSAAVLAPHADDEVFGCGAAIASLRAAGARVRVLLVTDGAGALPDPSSRARVAAARVEESGVALALLGGAELETAGLPDRGLLDRPDALRNVLAEFLGRGSQELLFVPAPCEVHPDHRAVARAVLELAATTLAPETRLAFYEVSQPIRPNFLLDATRWLPAKEAAMAAFPSQTGAHDYPRVTRGLMEYRSLTLGHRLRAAEAFFVTTAAELRERGEERLLRAIGPSASWP